MPMTGSRSPVFGMALVNGVTAALDPAERARGATAPKAAMAARNARRESYRVAGFMCRLPGLLSVGRLSAVHPRQVYEALPRPTRPDGNRRYRIIYKGFDKIIADKP
jgi:hypothetical protein